MIAALLYTILPTLLIYIFLPKIGLQIKSLYLKISIAWFTGLYLFTIFIFVLAVGFSFFTSSLLLNASIVAFISVCLTLIYFKKDLYNLKDSIIHSYIKKPLNLRDLLLIIFCFSFSFIFFIHHLSLVDGKIYVSPIY